MANVPQNYPGGSKSRVSRAGDAVRRGIATLDDELVIEEWRAAHRAVLNTFQAILRTRTRGQPEVVGQRHKRRNTIYDKLRRLPHMELARMDDIAGCRVIFEDVDALHSFRDRLHAARFKHRRRNAINKYDYIENPKPTGYRGIHDVYEYDVNSEQGKALKGLNVEIQYRTLVQHAWATAVEVIGFVTESQPKYQEGDQRYERALALASEILARAHEGYNGPLPELSDKHLVEEFLAQDAELGLLRMLEALHATREEHSKRSNFILIVRANEPLEVLAFAGAGEALRELFRLEKELPEADIVLVRADSSEEVRLAFRNYFSDARDFIRLIDEGCRKLTDR